MILKSIRLDNIRSYAGQSIDFPQGSFMLSGDIGAGKSSILLAAEFALFGIMRGELNGENLLRHGSKEGSVELKFSIDGSDVTIKRSLKRAKDGVKQESGYMIMDGRKTEGTHIELKTRILKLLGYPQDLLSKSKSLIYRYTVYTPQEQMKRIIFSDSDERLNILRRVFGVEKYKTVAENTVILIRALKEGSKELEGRASGIEEKSRQLIQGRADAGKTAKELDEIRSRLAAARKSAEDKSRLMSEAEVRARAFAETKKDLESGSARLDEKIMLRQRNEKEEKAIEAELDALKKRISLLGIKEAASADETERSIASKDIMIKSILEEKSELSERKRHLEIRLKEMKGLSADMAAQSALLEEKEGQLRLIKTAAGTKEEIREKIKAAEEGIRAMGRKMSESEVMKRNSESMIKKVSEIERCPTCLQSVSNEHKKGITSAEKERMKDAEASISRLKKEIEEKDKAVKSLQSALDEAINDKNRAEKLAAEIKLLVPSKEGLIHSRKESAKAEEELLSAGRRLAELEKEDISRLAKELEHEKAVLKKMQEASRLQGLHDEKSRRKQDIAIVNEELKRDIGAINAMKIELAKRMKGLEGAEELYRKARKDAEEARERQKSLEIDEKGLLTQHDGMRKMLESLEKEVEQKLAARIRLDRNRQLQDWLEKSFLGIIGLVERSVMQKVHSQFRSLFQEWFRMLVEDEAIAVGLDESFTPIVQQDGYEASLEGLSGGEKTAVALAYRLALNKVINDVISTVKTKDLIILDEPTDGFSSEQLDRVREVIDELGMKQVIIVSHEPKMEGFVDTVLRIGKAGQSSMTM